MTNRLSIDMKVNVRATITTIVKAITKMNFLSYKFAYIFMNIWVYNYEYKSGFIGYLNYVIICFILVPNDERLLMLAAIDTIGDEW